MVPVAGVEPARVISPTDFESVTSANSITPAEAKTIIRDTAVICKKNFARHGKKDTEKEKKGATHFDSFVLHYIRMTMTIRRTGGERRAEGCAVIAKKPYF